MRRIVLSESSFGWQNLRRIFAESLQSLDELLDKEEVQNTPGSYQNKLDEVKSIQTGQDFSLPTKTAEDILKLWEKCTKTMMKFWMKERTSVVSGDIFLKVLVG